MNVGKLAWILKTMKSDPRTKKAPVHVFESSAKNNFQILVSTMLSARTKDSTSIPIVNKLFKRIRTPENVLKQKPKSLEHSLYGIGFYRAKTKYLIEMSRILANNFGSGVPDTLEELLSLPGVGRKTANIVLARAFGKNTLGVDVHVHRISNRLGLVKTKKPEETEKQLIKLTPAHLLPKINRTFVAYGQTICLPIKPRCNSCKLTSICPKIGVKINNTKIY